MRNLQEQVKKAFCYQKLFLPFTVWINCSSDLKICVNSWPSASNFKFFSQLQEHFFLTVGQNNYGNKIPFLLLSQCSWPKLCLPWFWLLTNDYSLFFILFPGLYCIEIHNSWTNSARINSTSNLTEVKYSNHHLNSPIQG